MGGHQEGQSWGPLQIWESRESSMGVREGDRAGELDSPGALAREKKGRSRMGRGRARPGRESALAHTPWGGGRIQDQCPRGRAGRCPRDTGWGREGHKGGGGHDHGGGWGCRSGEMGPGGGGARRGSGMAVTEGGVGAQLAVVALVTFAGAPAVVAAALHQVHLLELVLAHVSAEEAPAARAGGRVAAVERAAPHVAHAQRVDLGPRGGVVHERVVARDAVERAALVAVHVDAQHLAQQRRPAGRAGGGAARGRPAPRLSGAPGGGCWGQVKASP